MKIVKKMNAVDMERVFVKLVFTLFGVSTCIVFFFSF